jgi:hypothetical protein
LEAWTAPAPPAWTIAFLYYSQKIVVVVDGPSLGRPHCRSIFTIL